MRLVKDFRGHLHLKSPKTKVLTMLSLAMVMSMSLCSLAFAATTPTPVDFSGVTSKLTTAFNVSEIASVIGVVLGAGVGFVIFWWGARKLVNGVISAFKSGKLRF